MEAGLIFLSFFLFGDNASFRKCPAEHKPHQRPRNDKLEGQRHDKILRNIGYPDQKQHAPLPRVNAGLRRAVKGHNQHHRNHHTAGNGDNRFCRAGDPRLYQKTEREPLCQAGHQKPVTDHGKHVGNRKSQPGVPKHRHGQLPMLQRHIIYAHP